MLTSKSLLFLWMLFGIGLSPKIGAPLKSLKKSMGKSSQCMRLMFLQVYRQKGIFGTYLQPDETIAFGFIKGMENQITKALVK